jgi:hypothetical protein
MARWKVWPVSAVTALVAGVLFAVLPGASAASPSRSVAKIASVGAHISSVARPEAMGLGRLGAGLAPQTTCSTPGATNYKADCNSAGSPVNETWIAYNGTTFVAGANDYNSWNGNADLGYYTSPDGKTWTDNGPLDLFPHGSNTAAGDPGLAIEAAGVVYYSGIYFDYVDCAVGGVELARKDPNTGAWSYYQILANSNAPRFQDKPAIMQDGRHVFVGWTEYHGSFCAGFEDVFPLHIAVFAPGAASTPPLRVLNVPGSTYSAGIAMASDGRGGVWVSWEEFPNPTSLQGSIQLNHWRPGAGWGNTQTISPPGFTDLPSPLPGFVFRNNSFPMIAFGGGQPRVVWNSYDTGVGRTYLWQGGSVSTVSNAGGDQFFASIAVNASQANVISWSQTNPANFSFDQYLFNGGVSKISTASSFPNNDPFFGGSFIGDYNATVVAGSTPHPIWTDLRGPTFAQHAFVYSP